MIPCLILLALAAGGIWYGVASYRLQQSWRKCTESGSFSKVEKEPFKGALCLSAIIQSCTGESTFSARIMEIVFGHRLDEWNAMTKAVSFTKGLNQDLLVENFVCILRKQDDSFRLKYLPLVFKALTAAEFMWNEKNQGEKPSVYLKSLLNYSFASDEKSDAYRVLGLEPGASPEKIRRAHRHLAARYHPDKGHGNLEMFTKIQTAYEMLK